jgi:hypothetical protein
MPNSIQQFPGVALDNANALLPSLRQELERLRAAGVIVRYWVESGGLLVECRPDA